MKAHSKASSLNTADEGKLPKASRSSSPAIYPFSMIVGQEEMKLALVLNAIDPLIGGVLLMGHRGTGKSTAVRALADLLGEIWTVRNCHYQCDPTIEVDLCSDCARRLELGEKLPRQRMPIPLVDLPLGATEDRVCGTIDIERALKDGVKSFEPGLLARANRGFLYVDEVNLLDDHLADLLLDVAATGRNKVEREAISIEHPARFVLIGSGNPEEGELRPQLLDRFGLHVEVKTEDDLDRRVEIVERRDDFENNPVDFCSRAIRDQQRIRTSISQAQKRVRKLKVNRTLLRLIAQLCTQLKIDGHRGEITIARAARALAAFEGRTKISEEDVQRVAVMSLQHRLRRDPLEETAGAAEQIRQALASVFSKPQNSRRRASDAGDGNDGFDSGRAHQPRHRRDVPRARGQSTISNEGIGTDSAAEMSLPADLDVVMPKLSVNERRQSEMRKRLLDPMLTNGQRARNVAPRSAINYQRGRYSRAVNFKKNTARVAIDATLRALASAGCQMSGVGYQASLLDSDGRLTPDTRHPAPSQALRYKLLTNKSGVLFILLIDASGSMAPKRIRLAKGAALSLLKDSYIRRDKVAIVGFRGTSAEVLLPPSKSMLRARRVLDSLGVGGGTPLSAGLLCSLRLAQRAQTGTREIALLVFTDGHANVSLRSDSNGNGANPREAIGSEIRRLGSELKRAGVKIIVVDSENRFISNEKTRDLADTLGGTYMTSSRLLAQPARVQNTQ